MTEVDESNKRSKDIQARKIKSFETAAEWIHGCIVTQDGKILLTDSSDRGECLIGYDSEGKQLFNILCAPYNAFDITCIDDTTVAVSSGRDNVISLININNQTVQKRIDVGHPCNGLAYQEGKLLVCAAYFGILSINLTDETKTTIIQSHLSLFSEIATNKNLLYYTLWCKHTVTCCDMNGTTLWVFYDSNILCYPHVITIDNEGHVYICDQVRHTIDVLSVDGTQSENFLLNDEKIKHPNALYFDKNTNHLFVANREKMVSALHVII